MQKLTLTITDYTDLTNAKLVFFDGDFDGYSEETISGLQNEVDKATPESRLIFDFSNLNYLNSFAIGQLVAWRNIMDTKHGKIVIVGINKNIQDIFSVLGIESVFKIYSNLDELKVDEAQT